MAKIVKRVTTEYVDKETGNVESTSIKENPQIRYWDKFTVIFDKKNLDILSQISGNATKVMLYMYCKTDFNNTSKITIRQISKDLGLSRQTISSCLKELSNFNVFKRDYVLKEEKRSFIINLDFAWKGSNNMRIALKKQGKKVKHS